MRCQSYIKCSASFQKLFFRLLLTLLLLVWDISDMHKVTNAMQKKEMLLSLAAFLYAYFILWPCCCFSLWYMNFRWTCILLYFDSHVFPSQPWVLYTLLFLNGHPRGTLASWAAFLTHWMDYKEVLNKSCSQSRRFACSFCSVFADKPDWRCFKVIGSLNADKAGPGSWDATLLCFRDGVTVLSRQQTLSLWNDDEQD